MAIPRDILRMLFFSTSLVLVALNAAEYPAGMRIAATEGQHHRKARSTLRNSPITEMTSRLELI